MSGESAAGISGVEGRKGATAEQDRGVGAAEGYLGGIGEADLGAECRAQRIDYLVDRSSRRCQGIAGQSSFFQGALFGTEKQNAPATDGHRGGTMQGIASGQSAKRFWKPLHILLTDHRTS